MAAVGAVIGLALVMAILLGDLHPVAGAAGRAPLVKVAAMNGWEAIGSCINRRRG